MNILGNNSSKLNEVIFENRNKNYGAFDMRQSYNESLIKSLVYLCSLVVLLFGASYIYSKVNKTEEAVKVAIFDDPNIKLTEYTTEMDITPLPEPVQNTAVAAVAPAGAVGTRIVDNPLDPITPVNLNTSISGTGSSTATGVSAIGSETSTVTTISVVATPSISIPTEYVVVEEMPEFEGGTAGLMKYVGQNIIYPSLAREVGKEGTVYVSFVVNETGNIEGAKIMRGIGFGCDEEVVRVINKMPRWKKVGKQGGHPVKVRYNIPVSFKLR